MINSLVRHKDGNPRNAAAKNLRYGDQFTNRMDMIRHCSPRIRLSPKIVRDLWRRLMSGEKISALAREIGVQQGLVWCLAHGLTWKDSRCGFNTTFKRWIIEEAQLKAIRRGMPAD